jgi:Leucine-rich repeat (LRR) protein
MSLASVDEIPWLPQITKLDLSETALVSTESLARWKHLRSLNLADTKVRDLSPLVALEVLTEINIGGCDHVADVSALAALPRLSEATCSFAHFLALKDLVPRELSFALRGEITNAQQQLVFAYLDRWRGQRER